MNMMDMEAATNVAVVFMTAGEETVGLGCTMKL